MQFADEAFDILGFTSEEKYNVYKVRTKEERERDLADIYLMAVWRSLQMSRDGLSPDIQSSVEVGREILGEV